MPSERRHLEHYGPDFARGPIISGAPEVAAVQIATQLAQLRVPLRRDDSEVLSHADFIRGLADRIFPDYAVGIRFDVSDAIAGMVTTQIAVQGNTPTVLHVWLADSNGGGVTATTPQNVSVTIGDVLFELTVNKQFLMLVPQTGLIEFSVTFGGGPDLHWACARNGRVFYSPRLRFF